MTLARSLDIRVGVVIPAMHQSEGDRKLPEASAMTFIVLRGDEAGVVLTPHMHEDGKYVASMTRFERDYIRVESIRELGILAKHGFSIRMSSASSGKHRAPSLISPGSLQIESRGPAVEA